ncbi:hypothetical protein NDU88_009095 [Pleurodeles waltl]|uniref:Uncharacterized protein n=1 Tax=Pleurodeles waltl TaxID=8319 RepID=A0AAV7P2V2_PLEWA|nr:hypothetical protein NDU88_009095 [Pleurodeles waltl]
MSKPDPATTAFRNPPCMAPLAEQTASCDCCLQVHRPVQLLQLNRPDPATAVLWHPPVRPSLFSDVVPPDSTGATAISQNLGIGPQDTGGIGCGGGSGGSLPERGYLMARTGSCLQPTWAMGVMWLF